MEQEICPWCGMEIEPTPIKRMGYITRFMCEFCRKTYDRENDGTLVWKQGMNIEEDVKN